MSPTAPQAAWIAAALLVGGLLGGVAGALVTGGRSAPVQRAAVPAANGGPAYPAFEPGSERVELLLGTLIDEVRALRTSLESDRRTAAAGAVEGQPERLEQLTATLEALTRTLQASGASGRGLAGTGLAVIDFPTRRANFEELAALKLIQDEAERVRPYLLWNYQQVLDHFGPPTTIWSNGIWGYLDPETGDAVAEMRFQDGLLVSIN